MIGIVSIAAPPIVRFGLKHLCRGIYGVKVVGDAADLGTGMRLVDQLRPEVVIVDLPCAARRPANADALGELISRNTKVIALLSPMLPPTLVANLLDLGVLGAVKNDADADDLERAINSVRRGSRFCNVGAGLTRERPRVFAVPGQHLTDKEVDVLALVAAGLSNQEIGETLFITENTAKFHVGNVIRKFGAKRRGELAQLAAPNGIFDAQTGTDSLQHSLGA